MGCSYIPFPCSPHPFSPEMTEDQTNADTDKWRPVAEGRGLAGDCLLVGIHMCGLVGECERMGRLSGQVSPGQVVEVS